MNENEILIQKLLKDGFIRKNDEFFKNEIKIKSIESSDFHSRRGLILHDKDIIISFNELSPSIELFDEALEKAHFFLSDYDDLVEKIISNQKIKPRETLIYNVLRRNSGNCFHQHNGKDCMNATYQVHVLSERKLPKINPIWWRTDLIFSFVQFEARSFQLEIFPRDGFNMGLNAKTFINEMDAKEAFLKGFEQIKTMIKDLLMNANFNI